MAQRRWFEPTQTGELGPADCAILNRAARNLWRPGHEPRRSDLMALRMSYKPGMSAADLIEEVAGALP
jgi:hypothetical protein